MGEAVTVEGGEEESLAFPRGGEVNSDIRSLGKRMFQFRKAV
jgi:hypothetical protein